jgi:tetratricopeptide (TPR) repeat protein
VTDSKVENDEEQDSSAEGDLTADERLEERLATPLLQGTKGLGKAQVGISAFLILVVAALLSSRGIGLPLQVDDVELLVVAPALHRVATASEAWNDTTLRPLAALVLAAGWQLSSGSSTFLHILGIAVHLLTSVLVYLLARRLLLRRTSEVVAMSAGLLFASHPAVTQSVYYVSHIGSLLATFLTLLSILLFLRSTEDEKKICVLGWGLSLTAFALAWASDLAVWTLPVLLVAVDCVARKGVDIRVRVLSYVPHTALLAFLFVSHGASADAVNGSPSDFYAQAETVFDHFRTVFFPANLSLVHPPFDVTNAGFPVMWIAFLAISIVLMWIAPLPGLAAFWVAVAAAGPGLFGLDDSFREERVYLSLAGVACLLPWLIDQVPRPPLRTFAGLAAVLLIVVSGYFNFQRTSTWFISPLLWSETRDECWGCLEPSRNLATIHLNMGMRGMSRDPARSRVELLRAEELLQYVIDEGGETAEVYADLASARVLLGSVESATEALVDGLRLDPSNHSAMLQMARLKGESAQQTYSAGDQRLALDFYENLPRTGPLSSQTAGPYAVFLMRLGEMRQSELLLRAVAASEPNSPAPQMLEQVESIVEALIALESKLQTQLETDPNDPEVLRVRINQKVLLGEFQNAVYLADELFEQHDPDLATWFLLAMSKVRMGTIDQFFDDWPEAPNPPLGATPWYELAKRLAGGGEWDAARHALERDAERVEDRPLPLVSLAGFALNVNDLQRGSEILMMATEAYPESPEPWLMLADLTNAVGQRDQAVQMLQRAKEKGADAAVLEELEKAFGADLTDSTPPARRSIIRQ